MQVFSFVNLKICVKILAILQFCCGSFLPNYLKLRNEIEFDEDKLLFGSRIELQNGEQRANKCLMSAKYQEIDRGFQNPSTFLPAKNFLEVQEEIRNSSVYKLIRRMPKGAVLHVHLPSLTSLDFIVEKLTYLPNLYACLDNNKLRFHFFQNPHGECNWILMNDLRANNVLNDTKIKQYLTSSMDKMKTEFDQNAVWNAFREILGVVYGLILYRPAFELYSYQGLQELYDDNVMYVEIRGTCDGLYELNGHTHKPMECIRIFKDTVDKFIRDHPNFWGAKIIYSTSRRTSPESFDYHIKTFKILKSAFPNLIGGFDLHGQEDLGQPLLDFAEKLLELGEEAQFYFHAGETNWYGQPTDENLIDAVLLKSRRIGHGLALLKHPIVLEMVKNRSIAIELNPISNQVLKYVGDMRNHPASYFFAKDFPVVVSNDDPNIWGARGLSDDFYETFIGIMSLKADLRALKQLAINSIIFSSMSEDEQTKAFVKWKVAWEEYINFLSSTQKCTF